MESNEISFKMWRRKLKCVTGYLYSCYWFFYVRLFLFCWLYKKNTFFQSVQYLINNLTLMATKVAESTNLISVHSCLQLFMWIKRSINNPVHRSVILILLSKLSSPVARCHDNYTGYSKHFSALSYSQTNVNCCLVWCNAINNLVMDTCLYT